MYFTRRLKYYRTIDVLPIWNYDKTMETGDVRHLLILSDYERLPKIGIRMMNQLVDIFQALNYQIIDHFGMSAEQVMILQISKNIEIAKLNLLINEDPSIQNEIAIMERRLAELLNAKKPSDQPMLERVAILELFRGIEIDTRRTTVKQYLTYLKLYDQHVEELKKLETKKTGKHADTI